MRYLATLLLTAIFALNMAAQAPAADADLDLVSKVKTALTADAAKLPLTVSVLDGVAVVGGAVPNAAMMDTLSTRIKAVPGLKDVRLNFWVPAHADPLAVAMKEKLKDATAAASQPVEQTAPRLTVLPALMTTVAQRPDGASGYSPVPPPAPPAPAGGPEHATIPPPRVPMVPAQNVATAVEAVKRFDARFAAVKLTVNYGTVTLAGHDADAAWDLAALVRRVPGVERVIVK